MEKSGDSRNNYSNTTMCTSTVTDKELRKTQGLNTRGVMRIQIRQQVNNISNYGNKLVAGK